MSDGVAISLHGGPWDGERRRFFPPISKTIFVKAGGEYRLVQDYRGFRYQWYAKQTDPPTGRGVVK